MSLFLTILFTVIGILINCALLVKNKKLTDEIKKLRVENFSLRNKTSANQQIFWEGLRRG